VNTLSAALDQWRLDAIILACAGLMRMVGKGVSPASGTDVFGPRSVQGVIGIECRSDDAATARCSRC